MPEVKVDSFRQELRRNLLNSDRFKKTNGFNYRSAFYLSTAVATIMAAILIIFVLRPGIPGQIHYSLAPESGQEPLTLENGHNLKTADKNGLTNSYNNLFRNERAQPTAQLDREFVRYLAKNEFNRNSADIQPINHGELYSISQFRLDDGRRAVVYTPVSYQQRRIRIRD